MAVQRRKVELILDGFVGSSRPLDVLGIGERDLLMGGEWLLQELNERELPTVLSNVECPTLQFTKRRSIPFQGVNVDFVSLVSSTMTSTSTIGSQLGPMSMLGDCIIEEPSEWLRENLQDNRGDIVVALIDKEEATLKKFRKKGDSIALEPANKSFKTQIYGPDRIVIQGKMSGLIRSYN